MHDTDELYYIIDHMIQVDNNNTSLCKHNVNISPIITQQQFLLHLGLRVRCDILQKNAPPKQQQEISSAAERLIDPRQMGTLFKVLAITSKNLTAIGF